MHLVNGSKVHVNSTKQNLKVTILQSKACNLRGWKGPQISRLQRTGKPSNHATTIQDSFSLVSRGTLRSPSSWLFFHWHLLPACVFIVDCWPARLEDGVLHLRWLLGTLKLGTASSLELHSTSHRPSLINTFIP